ncbi:TonB-dependent receptor domain-containing protein [Flavobacterium aquicola]|uniref:Outer membrane receptor protein involved in Fe transport n=1 Tax=Flavobacterium aquicola TaxID=1682742 RepID=A0A3E0ES36_9FLAO|nr:TonB-dependent receptor [Flavobacterium aquicola]REH01043.1 outer membrane receptor protein involved in Fe transport [Flavobacterium aquicola]
MTLTKQSLLTFILLFIFTISQAQNATIKGVVTDKQNNSSIEFASVALLKQIDSTIVTGVLTKNKGTFAIPKIDLGNFILKVVSVGYQTSYSNFTVSDKSQHITLDIFLNESSKLLGEVVVKGQGSKITNKLDKQTYKANQFESAKGGSATDVLKNLPSVSVNSAGEISVRGSTGFLVLINGKPVLTDAQTILSQLPANTIENIELITAPSAKYDADGKGGIINITTKKGTTDGFALQTNILAGLPSTTDYDNLENPLRFGGDATLNYKKDKWDIILSGNYTRNDANGRREGYVYTKDFDNNTITYFPSEGERSFDRYNYGVRTNINYSATKNDIFEIGFFASKKYQQRRADIVYDNSTVDITTGDILSQFTYFNSNLQNKEGEFLLGNFNYSHTFQNNSKLGATAIFENADLYGNTVNKNLDYPNKKTLFQLVTNPYTNPINGYRLKLDYSATIGEGKLETGYQYRWDKQDGTFDYNVTPPTNQPDIAKFSGTAKSINIINSAYTQYSSKFSELQYTAGLRYEYATREVDLSSDPNTHYLNLSNFFPSANLLYTINKEWNIKSGYSKRVQRNNNFELNPIPEREHSETLEQGDPDLLPQFIDLVELGVNHNFKKGSFFATLYYQNIKNPIQRVNSVYADTILNRVFTNAEKARLIGLEFGTTQNPAKWVTAYLGANVYNYKISGHLDVLGATSDVNNADWVYSINMNTTFNLGNNWSMQANVNYLSNRPTAQGEDSSFLSPNTSVKKTFGNGKYAVGLQWQNMNLGFMDANQQRITTWGNDFYTTTNYIYETDVFLLNFSVNLNKLSSKTKLPASELGEKEF